jgi:hypothetical protein
MGRTRNTKAPLIPMFTPQTAPTEKLNESDCIHARTELIETFAVFENLVEANLDANAVK